MLVYSKGATTLQKLGGPNRTKPESKTRNSRDLRTKPESRANLSSVSPSPDFLGILNFKSFNLVYS